nr:hypothetical protein [Tanacetum cinerariifolium]
MTHSHLQRNVVPTTVLARSRRVSLNAARPVTTAVTQSTVICTRTIKNVFNKGNPQQALQDKGVIDSGCSRHMTGNISFLSNFKEIDEGYVAFGRNSKGGNQPNDNAGIKENLDAGKVRKETVFVQQYVLLSLWSSDSQDPKNTYNNVVDDAFEVKENEI